MGIFEDDNKDLKLIPNAMAHKWLNEEDFDELVKWDDWYEKNFNQLPEVRYYQNKNKLGLTAVYLHEGEAIARISLKADLYKDFFRKK